MQEITVTIPKARQWAAPKPPSREAVLKAVMPRKSTLEIVTQAAIAKGTLQATDLEVWAITQAPEGMAEGVYRLINKTLALNQATPLADWPLAQDPGEQLWACTWNHPEALEALRVARSADLLRPALMGVHVQAAEDEALCFTATDGHRLVRRWALRADMGTEAGAYVMHPRLVDMAVLCRGYGSMAFGCSLEHQTLQVGPWTFVAQQPEGVYPNIERVLPEASLQQDQYNRRELIAAIKALQPFANKVAPCVAFYREASNVMRLECRNSELDLHAGAVVTMVRRMVKEGNPIAGHDLDLLMPIRLKERDEAEAPPEYTFNPRYMVEALEHIPGDLVELRWTSAEQAFMIRAI